MTREWIDDVAEACPGVRGNAGGSIAKKLSNWRFSLAYVARFAQGRARYRDGVGRACVRLADRWEHVMIDDLGGFVALAALMVGLIAWLRTDMNRRMDRLETRLNERVSDIETRLNERMDGLETRLSERMDGLEARMDRLETGLIELRERMAHMEGMLDGLREAIVTVARRAAA